MALQKQLRGISNFLGLYKQGEVRLDLSPTLQPVIDAGEFLQPADNLNTLNTLGAVGAVATCGTCPDNEIWNCKWMGMRFTNVGISAGCIFRPIVIYLGVEYGLSELYAGAGGSPALGVDVLGMNINGLQLSPGMELGFRLVRATAVGSVDCENWAQVQRIKV